MEENVNKLLEAEKEASKIITNALTAKSAKIKEAPEYAKGEFEKYRQAQEEKYNAILQSLQQNQSINTAEKAEQESKKALESMNNNKGGVIKLLMENVMNVEIEVPRVMKGIDENMEY